jgi:hypothetical protein
MHAYECVYACIGSSTSNWINLEASGIMGILYKLNESVLVLRCRFSVIKCNFIKALIRYSYVGETPHTTVIPRTSHWERHCNSFVRRPVLPAWSCQVQWRSERLVRGITVMWGVSPTAFSPQLYGMRLGHIASLDDSKLRGYTEVFT